MSIHDWRKRRLRRTLGHLWRHPSDWRQFLRSLRYRLDRNALRFTAQTIKPLASRPEASNRRLVFFAHFDRQNVVDPYVVYYIRALKELGAEIIFVSGSPELSAESAKPLLPYCSGIYSQETLALDFGSWNLAWQQVNAAGWRLNDFDQLIFANDSVYGPLFDLQEMFQSFEGADIYGTTENLEIERHLQSYFLVFELNPRTTAFVQRFFADFQYEVIKQDLIIECEVGLSYNAEREGLVLKPYISDAAVRAAVARHSGHQFREAIAKVSVNNTLFFWDLLISDLRCPLLKTEIPKNNPYGSTLVPQLEQFLRSRTSFPPELISNHLARLRGLGSMQPAGRL